VQRVRAQLRATWATRGGHAAFFSGVFVSMWLIDAFDLRPLRIVDTGNIRFDLPASFTLWFAVVALISFALFGLYTVVISALRALNSR
jgi:hypothetical protein